MSKVLQKSGGYMTQGSGGYMTQGSGGYMTQGSGGYIFHANIEPSRFSNQWLDWGVWQIWSSAITEVIVEQPRLHRVC